MCKHLRDPSPARAAYALYMRPWRQQVHAYWRNISRTTCKWVQVSVKSGGKQNEGTNGGGIRLDHFEILHIFCWQDIKKMYQLEGKYPDRRSHLALEHLRLKCPQSYNSGGLLPTNGQQWHRIRSLAQVGPYIFNCRHQEAVNTRPYCCNFFFWQPVGIYKSKRATW